MSAKKKYKRSTGLMSEMPSKDVIYGPEGVGKTSLLNTYPNPVILDFEGSTSDMEADRVIVNTWDAFTEVVYDIVKTDEFSDIVTVGFDTLDWFEKLCINRIMEEDGASSMTDLKLYGYGKGDIRIKEFLNKTIYPILRSILMSKRNIVIVAHSKIKSFDDPINGKYDTYQMKVGEEFSSFFREWCSNLYFMNYDLKIISGESKFSKKKAIGSNARYIYTQRTPQYSAKSRYNVGAKLLFKEGFNPYAENIKIKHTDKEKHNIRINAAIAELKKATDYHDIEMIDTAFQDIANGNEDYKAIRLSIIERLQNEQQISEG